MKLLKQLTTSKRMWLTALFSGGLVVPIIESAQTVKTQTDGVFSGLPYGEIISYGVTAVYVALMAWTKLHDDSKK